MQIQTFYLNTWTKSPNGGYTASFTPTIKRAGLLLYTNSNMFSDHGFLALPVYLPGIASLDYEVDVVTGKVTFLLINLMDSADSPPNNVLIKAISFSGISPAAVKLNAGTLTYADVSYYLRLK